MPAGFRRRPPTIRRASPDLRSSCRSDRRHARFRGGRSEMGGVDRLCDRRPRRRRRRSCTRARGDLRRLAGQRRDAERRADPGLGPGEPRRGGNRRTTSRRCAGGAARVDSSRSRKSHRWPTAWPAWRAARSTARSLPPIHTTGTSPAPTFCSARPARDCATPRAGRSATIARKPSWAARGGAARAASVNWSPRCRRRARGENGMRVAFFVPAALSPA